MTKFIILFICFAAAQAEAQWSEYWPAWEYPRRANTQLEDLGKALAERLDARTVVRSRKGDPLPVESEFPVSRWRLKRSIFINMKEQAARNIKGFYSKEEDLPSPTLSLNSFVSLTVEKVSELARIPTNFFDYTPLRGLNGLGGLTNDTTVGHPHGFTNYFTANGGTNFPDGRTCWYTTDYGFDSFKRVLKEMERVGYYQLHPCLIATNREASYWGLIGTSSVSYIDAVANAQLHLYDDLVPVDDWDYGIKNAENWQDTCVVIEYYEYVYPNYTVEVLPPEIWRNVIIKPGFWGDQLGTVCSGYTLTKLPFTSYVYCQWTPNDWFGIGGNEMEYVLVETIQDIGSATNTYGSIDFGYGVTLPLTGETGHSCLSFSHIIVPDYLYQ